MFLIMTSRVGGPEAGSGSNCEAGGLGHCQPGKGHDLTMLQVAPFPVSSGAQSRWP